MKHETRAGRDGYTLSVIHELFGRVFRMERASARLNESISHRFKKFTALETSHVEAG